MSSVPAGIWPRLRVSDISGMVSALQRQLTDARTAIRALALSLGNDESAGEPMVIKIDR